MLIIFPAVQSGGAIMRIYYYFYIFMIIYIPNMIAKIDQKKDRGICGIVLFLYILVGLYMFYSTLSGNSLNIMPYQFFWQA